ncbi:MAG: LPXTG cell wall anchor domain-containing protein [Finegoldia magna]|uniref:LPXTG cell wall anchor domain-containing protein n=2 Tax=Finegoldia magna TaxID=1260 RepID=UPI00290B5030|nr:LPXTG cell wall anchor domain-containing protein [Finegoldia magna]MDU5526921.1 LPXTG cell wall anchor domain-containing protein [Finegoldia magna]MDU5809004.1 LPXTG cell wall anchor domain-containing protein [Finegoldia magna]
MKKKLTIYVVAVMMFLMHIGYNISYGQKENNIMLASTQILPQAGIDNEHILISIACLIVITGAFFVFFKKREKK